MFRCFPQIPFVRSAGCCNREAAPETNTYCKEDLQNHPSDSLCRLTGQTRSNYSKIMFENTTAAAECLKEAAFDPKYLHRQRSSVTLTLTCFIHPP